MSYMIVSIREFQKYAGKYLKELPITLTKFGKPVATVIQYKKDVRQSVIQKEEDVRQMSDNSTIPVENIPAENMGWCELHFEKGVKYPLTLISWEDENGESVIKEKWACPKCVKKYENLGRGKVYYGESSR